MTTTDTPVWNMPKPGMLPNGMPLPAEADETLVTILNEDQLYGNMIVRVARSLNPKVTREEIYGNPTQRTLDRLFDDAISLYFPPFRPTPRAAISQESIVQRLESLRSLLHITAEAAASIAGLAERRFYELRRKPFPSVRLAEIHTRVSIINSLGSRDWQTMRALIAGRRDEVIDLLDRARFAELGDLFQRTHDELNAVLVRGGLTDYEKLTIDSARDVSAILDAPGFDDAAKVIAYIGRIDAETRNRGKALLEVAETFDALEHEGEIAEHWDFLFGLDADERTGFRDRAETFVRSDEFSQERWQAFLADESERAWNAATPMRLEPLESSVADYADEDDAASSWQPDVMSMGIDFSLLDRRRR